MKLLTIPVGMLQTNCYILVSEKGNGIVIDPGAQAEKILQAAKDHEVKIRGILLTHGHFDHILAANAVRGHTGCNLLMSQKDEYLALDPGQTMSLFFEDSVEACVQPDGYLEEASQVSLDELTIQVLETPGHTKGGLSFLCNDLLFSGDTLFAGGAGRTDLEGGDFPTLRQSLKKLASLRRDYTVLPGHGEQTTLEEERGTNPYMGTDDYDAIY